MMTDVVLALSPLLILAGGTLALMLVEALSSLRYEGSHSPSASLASTTAIVALASAAAAAGLWLYGPQNLPGASVLAPHLVIDHFSLFFFIILGLSASLTALLAAGYLPEHRLDRGEFYPLLLLSTAGAMALSASSDLLTLFLGLETMSLGAYAMIAFRHGSHRAVEAGMKYFLLGSFAAAILLYGGALLYGATGSTDLAVIGQQIARTGTGQGPAPLQQAYANSIPLVLVGLGLMLVGLAFKVSAIPFHMWTPDAYEGAPTPTTTFMAAAIKAAGFAMMLRVLLVAFSDPKVASWAAGWAPVVATLAVLTMTVGNLIAGRQESVKRMLAYSSIAHAGYILVGVVAATRVSAQAQASVIFYVLVYAVSTIGAFGALLAFGSRGAEATSYEDLAGVGRRHPALALAFSLFLLSLAGVPPAAGFFGKLYLVRAAIGADMVALAVILLLNSVVGAYYYLRVLVYMYMREPAPGAPIAKPMRSGAVGLALAVSALLVLLLGIVPGDTLKAAVLASLGN